MVTRDPAPHKDLDAQSVAGEPPWVAFPSAGVRASCHVNGRQSTASSASDVLGRATA